MPADRAIQHIPPARIEPCGDVPSYVNAIWRAASAGEPIADYGRYHTGLGHPPPPDHVQIDPPAGVVDHYVADMAVRVLAGTTLGDIQRALAPRRQFLPVDGPADMTIAEVVAHHVSGSLRPGHGTVRDGLLGLRYVDAQGQIITVGGRTVKNVAGYDVTRLMVGSLNTLGLIAEVTLRTTAYPEQVVQVDVDAVDPPAFSMAVTDLLTSDAAPWALEWEHINTMAGLRPNVLRFAYAGSVRECQVQQRALESWLEARGWLGGNLSARTVSLEQDLATRTARWEWRGKAGAVLKIVVPPAQTGKLIEALFKLDAPPPMIHALPTHGVIHLGAGWPPERARQIDLWLKKQLASTEGFRVWIRRPNHAADIPPVAPDQPDWTMLMRLKAALDPHNVFNPGRFP